MKKLFTSLLASVLCVYAVAQTLSFTGCDGNQEYVELDRVVVTNHTKGWQRTLFWPDSVLVVQNVSTFDDEDEDYTVTMMQNSPNPFNGSTDAWVTLDDAGEVTMMVLDMNGQAQAMHTAFLEAATHQFHIAVAEKGMYLLAAYQNGKASAIKMICNEGAGSYNIEYQGALEGADYLAILPKTTDKNYGDEMEYVGYANIDGKKMVTQRIMQKLGTSETITLPIAGEATEESSEQIIVNPKDYRIALSLSPFSLKQFKEGYSFVVGDRTASTPEELQKIYRDLGSTEMYVRIATKRHVTAEDITDGEKDENANVHTFDQGIEMCRIAASLNIPINPEIMCAYTYMDMDKIQAPRFQEYPEIYALQHGKDWSELSLEEICTVLEAYGAFLAEEILKTGCTVNNWNLGNEANFGFAGVGMGAKTAVDKKLGNASAMKRYMASIFSVWWLKKHVWKYEAQTLAAVKRGVLSAYKKLGIDATNVKFSTHIATVVFTPRCSASFFQYMAEHGYKMETAGISYYPSAPAMALSKKGLLTKTVTKINKKCGVPVFIGEFSYPSGKMDGPFAGWNKKVKGYEHNQQGQADIYSDVVAWGKQYGMAGVRYWAPDYEGWYAMSMFEFSNKVGTAKNILKHHKEIVEK